MIKKIVKTAALLSTFAYVQANAATVIVVRPVIVARPVVVARPAPVTPPRPVTPPVRTVPKVTEDPTHQTVLVPPIIVHPVTTDCDKDRKKDCK